MTAARTLPPNYTLRWNFDLKREWRAGLLLQIAGLGLFIAFGILFGRIIQSMRHDLNLQQTIVIASMSDALYFTAVLVGMMILVVLMHEWVHGLFFWIFTRQQPVFGVGWGYAYACAPGWYFPRWQYLIVGLAPLVLLTLGGLAAIAIAPSNWVTPIYLGLLINASGAVGDLWITARIAREPGEILVEDTGDGFKVYGSG